MLTFQDPTAVHRWRAATVRATLGMLGMNLNDLADEHSFEVAVDNSTALQMARDTITNLVVRDLKPYRIFFKSQVENPSWEDLTQKLKRRLKRDGFVLSAMMVIISLRASYEGLRISFLTSWP